MTDHASTLETVFETVPEESSYRLEAEEGEIPPFVRGTYYLNGPARFRRGGLRYRSWLDGDGMISSLRFDRDGVRFTNRFVRTRKLAEEERAGRPLYRTFGTTFRGDRLFRGVALASPANVSVYPFAGRLLAFGEQGLPWELDPESLETGREYTFEGQINPVSPFAAHPKIDPLNGELFNFGVSFSNRRPGLTLYRFAADGTRIFRRRHELDHPRCNHDFALSRRHAVFYLSPHLLDMEAVLEGASVSEALSWEPGRGSRLLILSRETGDRVLSLSLGSGYCLHLANAWEEGSRLRVDLIELEEPVYPDYEPLPELFAGVKPGRPVRLEVDLEGGELVGRREAAYLEACDFPSVPAGTIGRRCERLWMLGISATGRTGGKFFDELVHVRWSDPGSPVVHRAREGRLLGGEPVFVGDPENGGRGVLLCQAIDSGGRESSFLLFDAFDLERGPVARLPLRAPIPPGFHACFEPV